jgi:hypothetical protein
MSMEEARCYQPSAVWYHHVVLIHICGDSCLHGCDDDHSSENTDYGAVPPWTATRCRV